MRLKDRLLRVAFLVYRGNPQCGGQGVYTRYLTRELKELGVWVEVFSGPPYPELEDGITLHRVQSLDLYREPDPFRIPKLKEFKSLTDILEFAIMLSAGFPEPLTFSLRTRQILKKYLGQFDIVHDNQCLGYGLKGMMKDGFNVIGTIHHPITVDRDLDLMHAKTLRKKISVWRWYGFLRMQKRVARSLEKVITVSNSSKNDISEFLGVSKNAISVVPVGVDHEVFKPLSGIKEIPGRIITTASSDIPMKGQLPLLEAIAKLKTERDIELIVVGKLRENSPAAKAIERLNLRDTVSFVHGISDGDLVKLYASAQVAVVPSLYEGFSLPAIEAMACGTALVGTTGGAIPEVVGKNGETALLVEPNNPAQLVQAIGSLLENETQRNKLGANGRERVLGKFTWQATAKGTLEAYEEFLESKAYANRKI